MIKPLMFRTKVKTMIVVMTVLLSFVSTVIINSPAQAQNSTIEDVVREADAGNYEAAYQHLETLARSGNAQAQGFLSYVLSIGEWHVSVNMERAKTLLRSAMQQGDGYANTVVGLMNEPDADIQAGDLFIKSDDYLKNYLIAANAGNPHAQYAIAYETRIQKKYNESLEWFKKSASSGMPFAKAKLIIIEDIERSRKLKNINRLLSVYTMGFPEIYYHLAYSYRQAIGVSYNHSFSLTYAKLAKYFSGGKIDLELSLFKSELSDQEQAEALSRAETWIFEWAGNPRTQLWKPAKWCKTNKDWTISCITNAPFANLECMVPYREINFQHPQDFPGYSKCRSKRRINPNF